MYWAQPLKWYSFKERRIRRRLNRFLDLIENRREIVTEEIVYPITKVYHHSNNNHYNIKQLSLTNLPVVETLRVKHVTQISCKPLEFVPKNLYRY